MLSLELDFEIFFQNNPTPSFEKFLILTINLHDIFYLMLSLNGAYWSNLGLKMHKLEQTCNFWNAITISVLKSVKWLRLDSVGHKWGQKHPLSFVRCPD